MFRKSKTLAEKILAKEDLSEENLSRNLNQGFIDENESLIAKKLYLFLRSSGSGMTNSDKEQIKNQIRLSVTKFYFRRHLVRWSVAASILLAVFLTSIGYLQINSDTEIVQFAQTLSDIKAENNTRIILQSGEEVRIEKKLSQIKYDVKGENILIDSGQKIVQKTDNTNETFNTVIVPYGKRTQIILSEGTIIWLNSGSKLIYPVIFAKNKREVYIEGEAVFEVSHMNDKPFVVSTKDFDIKVLGTIFNVSAYSDDKNSSAVLAQGKIELVFTGASILSKKKLEISPGSMAVFDHNQRTFEKTQVNPQIYLSWRDGYLTLNREKLENILKKLSRYYNVEMVITDNKLKNATFSGSLDLKNSPEEVLSVVNETTPLTYSIDHEKIFINPK